MRTLATLTAGIGMILVGTLKAMATNRVASPFEAFWCRTPGLPASEPGPFLAFSFEPHCWGCPVALVGSLIVAAALLLPKARRSSRRDAAPFSH